MTGHQVFLLLFSISSCLFFINIQSSHHSRAEHKQFRIVFHISVPPAPAPAPEAAAASPSYSAKSPNNPSDVTDDTQVFKLAWDMACQND